MIWFRNSEEIFLSFFLKCLWERTAILLPLNIYYINWKSLKGSGHVRQPNGFGFEKGSNQEKSYHKRWHHSDWKRVKRREDKCWNDDNGWSVLLHFYVSGIFSATFMSSFIVVSSPVQGPRTLLRFKHPQPWLKAFVV